MTDRGKRPGLTSVSFASEQGTVNGSRNDFDESVLNCGFYASVIRLLADISRWLGRNGCVESITPPIFRDTWPTVARTRTGIAVRIRQAHSAGVRKLRKTVTSGRSLSRSPCGGCRGPLFYHRSIGGEQLEVAAWIATH